MVGGAESKAGKNSSPSFSRTGRWNFFDNQFVRRLLGVSQLHRHRSLSIFFIKAYIILYRHNKEQAKKTVKSKEFYTA